MRELPLWAVLFVSGLVLLVGLGDDSSQGVVYMDSEGPMADSAAAPQPPLAASADVGPLRLAEVMGAERVALELESGDLRAMAATAGESGGSDGIHAGRLRADGSEFQVPPQQRSRGETQPLTPTEEGAFVAGIRHGDWRIRWPNGETHSKGRYEEGLRDGLWQSYSMTGQLLEDMTYADGALEGAWCAYSQNGEVIGEGQHEDNHRVGIWTLRYSDGRIKEQGTYADGLREGHWEFYDDLGRPTIRSGHYSAGVKID